MYLKYFALHVVNFRVILKEKTWFTCENFLRHPGWDHV